MRRETVTSDLYNVPMIDVLILAAIALFVLSRLYIALGRDDGSSDAPRPASASQNRRSIDKVPAGPEPVEASSPVFTGPAAGGLEEIYKADNNFETSNFLQGAKAAYEMIVDAFAQGNRDELRPMLDDDVYEAWDAAITERERSGSSPYELLRLKTAEIEDASLEAGVARVMVRYEAELGDGEHTRIAKEIWTFMRDVSSKDPKLAPR